MGGIPVTQGRTRKAGQAGSGSEVQSTHGKAQQALMGLESSCVDPIHLNHILKSIQFKETNSASFRVPLQYQIYRLLASKPCVIDAKIICKSSAVKPKQRFNQPATPDIFEPGLKITL